MLLMKVVSFSNERNQVDTHTCHMYADNSTVKMSISKPIAYLSQEIPGTSRSFLPNILKCLLEDLSSAVYHHLMSNSRLSPCFPSLRLADVALRLQRLQGPPVPAHHPGRDAAPPPERVPAHQLRAGARLPRLGARQTRHSDRVPVRRPPPHLHLPARGGARPGWVHWTHGLRQLRWCRLKSSLFFWRMLLWGLRHESWCNKSASQRASSLYVCHRTRLRRICAIY